MAFNGLVLALLIDGLLLAKVACPALGLEPSAGVPSVGLRRAIDRNASTKSYFVASEYYRRTVH